MQARCLAVRLAGESATCSSTRALALESKARVKPTRAVSPPPAVRGLPLTQLTRRPRAPGTLVLQRPALAARRTAALPLQRRRRSTSHACSTCPPLHPCATQAAFVAARRRAPLALPAAYCPEFRAAAVTAASCDAAVAPKYAGLRPAQLDQVCRVRGAGSREGRLHSAPSRCTRDPRAFASRCNRACPGPTAHRAPPAPPPPGRRPSALSTLACWRRSPAPRQRWHPPARAACYAVWKRSCRQR